MKRTTLLIIWIFALSMVTEAQKFHLLWHHRSSACIYRENYCHVNRLYFGVENKVVLRATSPGYRSLRNVTLVGDSMFIKRINDSIFSIRTFYPGETSKVLRIINIQSGELIEKRRIYLASYPFNVRLVEPVDGGAPFYMFYEAKAVYLRWSGEDVFVREFRILSYDLVFQREDSVLLKIHLKEGQLIPRSFKDSVSTMEKKHMDGFFAENLLLRRRDGYEFILSEPELLLLYWKPTTGD